MTGSPSDELVDVVDEHDEIVGQATRAEVRANNLRHRCVFILVVSEDRERVLVHQRADWKDMWPSRWDIAFGGVLAAGETYDAAAERELAEEAGVTGVGLEHLGNDVYADNDVSECAAVYRTFCDGPFSFADGEVVATEWVRTDEIPERLAGASWCPDSVALALHLLRIPVDP